MKTTLKRRRIIKKLLLRIELWIKEIANRKSKDNHKLEIEKITLRILKKAKENSIQCKQKSPIKKIAQTTKTLVSKLLKIKQMIMKLSVNPKVG